MADEEYPGTCVCCQRRDPWRREDGAEPLVCGPCRSRLRGWLGDISGYCDRLAGQSSPGEVAVVEEERRWPVRLDDDTVVTAVERVRVASLPGALTAGRSRGGPVSGTAEAPVPVDVDALDLLGPRRPLRVDPPNPVDQVGHDSVWSVLSYWAADLAEHRGRFEHGQRPRYAEPVRWLAGWLLDRVDEACDDWPLVGEFAGAVLKLWAALRAELGEYDGPEYHKGIPCPKCGALTLLRQPRSDFITCATCPAVLSIPEYEEYVQMTSAEAVAARKKAAEERRAVVRLLRSMHALGWRHTVEHEVDHDPETGAPEPYRTHRWTRGDEAIGVDRMHTDLVGALLYWPHPDADYAETCAAGVGWVAAVGVKRLHALASAAGVLSVPKERA